MSSFHSSMEGQSIVRPPFFDGSNFSYWKTQMSVWVQGLDYELWVIICNGPLIPVKVVKDDKNVEMTIPKEPSEFNNVDKKRMQLN